MQICSYMALLTSYWIPSMFTGSVWWFEWSSDASPARSKHLDFSSSIIHEQPGSPQYRTCYLLLPFLVIETLLNIYTNRARCSLNLFDRPTYPSNKFDIAIHPLTLLYRETREVNMWQIDQSVNEKRQRNQIITSDKNGRLWHSELWGVFFESFLLFELQTMAQCLHQFVPPWCSSFELEGMHWMLETFWLPG